jgi:putative acetyltransferase
VVGSEQSVRARHHQLGCLRVIVPLIRPFERPDAGVLAALFHAAVHDTCPRDYTAAQVGAWSPSIAEPARFAARCEAKPTWVATLENDIAGFSDLERDGHIDMLFVHPNYQRRGVANALLRFLESDARRRGMPRLYTEASITARPVFERSGFQSLAMQTVVIRGVAMNNFKMEKLLDPLAAATRGR